jgi:hypothetical protein
VRFNLIDSLNFMFLKKFTIDMFYFASGYFGNLITVEFAISLNSDKGELIMYGAAAGSNFIVLEFGLQKKIEFGHFRLTKEAALHNNVNVLNWARDNRILGYHFNYIALYSSIERGHIDVLDFVEKYYSGHIHIPSVIAHAIKSGQIKILNLLLQRNYKFDYKSFVEAIKYNHIEIAEWILTNGSNIFPYAFIEKCLLKENLDLLKYLYGMNIQFCESDILEAFIDHSDHVLDFLRSVGYFIV